MAALADRGHVERTAAHNEKWLRWLTGEIEALGLRVTPSVGNFVLVKFRAEKGRDAEAANAALIKAGIIPRMMGGYGLGDCLRITIGREDEMRAARDALAKFVGKA